MRLIRLGNTSDVISSADKKAIHYVLDQNPHMIARWFNFGGGKEYKVQSAHGIDGGFILRTRWKRYGEVFENEIIFFA